MRLGVVIICRLKKYIYDFCFKLAHNLSHRQRFTRLCTEAALHKCLECVKGMMQISPDRMHKCRYYLSKSDVERCQVGMPSVAHLARVPQGKVLNLARGSVTAVL